MDRHTQVFGSIVYFAASRLHLENISGVIMGKGGATISDGGFRNKKGIRVNYKNVMRCRSYLE